MIAFYSAISNDIDVFSISHKPNFSLGVIIPHIFNLGKNSILYGIYSRAAHAS